MEVIEENTLLNNSAPFAGDDYVSTIVNKPVIGSWVSNDGDNDGDWIRLNSSLVNLDLNNLGQDSIIESYTTQMGGSLDFYRDGNFKYTPMSDYYGHDQFAYRICDISPNSLCDSATIYFLTAPLYYDFGDLPSQFPSAGQMIPIDFDFDERPDLANSIWFGEIVDHELVTSESNTAEGDNNAGSNDEDGLVFPDRPKLGTTANFEVLINGSDPGVTVYFGLWFDWDFDGVFDDFYNGSGVTSNEGLRAASSVSVPVDLPSWTSSEKIAVRLRAFQSMPNASQFGGNYRSGEVEDYVQYVLRGNVLPVELTEFNVIAKENNALLTWQTASEINNDYFSVQRSIDAINWEEIGIVEGNGTTIEAQYYEFDDLDLESNIYYYRIQQFDYDGANDFSDIKSITIKAGASVEDRKLSVYPNPVQSNGQLNINGVQNEMIDMIIYNIDGSEKANVSLPANLSIDLSRFNLKSGTYILQMRDGDYYQSEKIIVFE
ncbi:MAG: GEVED domain-containing protein [Chitinophagales bacterium]